MLEYRVNEFAGCEGIGSSFVGKIVHDLTPYYSEQCGKQSPFLLLTLALGSEQSKNGTIPITYYNHIPDLNRKPSRTPIPVILYSDNTTL